MNQMGISEKKMKIVINNYFKEKCDTDTSIREAFEKGFRIGVEKGQSMKLESQKKGKWIDNTFCSECGWIHEIESGFIGSVNQFNFCPNCGADMRESVL